MRIHISVPVTGEVLGRTEDARALHAPQIGSAHPGDLPGILPEGAGVDDRVCRIVVNVHHRRVIHEDLEGVQLFADAPAGLLYKQSVGEGAELHRTGESGVFIIAHRRAPFPVDRDDHRDPGERLKLIDHLDVVGQTVVHDDQAAKAFADPALLSGPQFGRLLRVDRLDDKLRDFLAAGHRCQ